MLRRLVTVILVVVGLMAPSASSEVARAVARRTITVDASHLLGPSNERLGGLGWNTGSLEGVRQLRPPTVRIDASLQEANPAEGELELDPLLDKVAAVRAIGAEPQVILSYMPAWRTGSCRAGQTSTRVAPCDLTRWEELVKVVVETLAAAPAPAYRFEVWNEPDWAPFWQDTLPAFLQMAAATHRAVRAVAEEEDLPLEIGGPATLFADPAWIVPYVVHLDTEELPLDYVSWHHYGNYPFLGPDGAEDPALEPVMPVVGRRNPAATPGIYALQVEQVRAWVDAALAESTLAPELVIDEWNLSAGGRDRRHDTNEGAAFAAATLVEMERAGLDAADFYRAADDPRGPSRRGDWGLVDSEGRPKPTWWVFRAWQRTAGSRLAVQGDDPDGGLWARATGAGRRVDVLLSAFRADGRDEGHELRVEIGATRCHAPAELRLLDGPDGDLATVRRVPVAASSVDLELPPQSVAWLRLRGCTPDRTARPVR